MQGERMSIDARKAQGILAWNKAGCCLMDGKQKHF